jgi:hypothetical protein
MHAPKLSPNIKLYWIGWLPVISRLQHSTESIWRKLPNIVFELHANDPDMVEQLCYCGQVKELVRQADDEMIVLDMYLKERLWEEIDYDVDVEIDYNPDPSKDSEGLDGDEEESSPSK